MSGNLDLNMWVVWELDAFCVGVVSEIFDTDSGAVEVCLASTEGATDNMVLESVCNEMK